MCLNLHVGSSDRVPTHFENSFEKLKRHEVLCYTPAMGANDVLNQVEKQWDDQVEYAETLRDRRKQFTAMLVVAVGLGAFRVDLHVDPDQIVSISNPTMRWWLKLCVIISGISFASGAFYLFRSGHKSEKSPRRASELLEFTDEEIIEIMNQPDGSSVSVGLRVWKTRLAVLQLSAGNRRISDNIKKGSAFVAAGYALLAVCATLYVLGRNPGINTLSETVDTEGGIADVYNNEETIKQTEGQSPDPISTRHFNRECEISD